jgi:hypothetical protein
MTAKLALHGEIAAFIQRKPRLPPPTPRNDQSSAAAGAMPLKCGRRAYSLSFSRHSLNKFSTAAQRPDFCTVD